MTEPDELEARDTRHESPGGTLGIAIGLALVVLSILGLVLGSFRAGGEALDGQAYAATVFRRDAVPFGLAPVEAVKLASRVSVVRFERSGEGADVEPDAESDAPPSDPEARELAAPDELTFLEYPSREAARRVFLSGAAEGGRRSEREHNSAEATREASANLTRWEKDPSFAWHTTVDAGVVDWSRWGADFRIERSFREGGTWCDSGRFDLCQDGRNLIVFARWPIGVEVTEEHLRAVLVELRMLDPEQG